MKDDEIHQLYRELVEREFDVTLERLRARGHAVTVRIRPFEPNLLWPEQAQVEVGGKIECWQWDVTTRRWPAEERQ